MINYKKIIKNLKALEGKKFDEDEIISSFEDVEEEVIISKCIAWSNFENEGTCRLYNVYVNLEDEPIFEMYVNEVNKIVSIDL